MSSIFRSFSKFLGRSGEYEQAAEDESQCPHAAGRSNVVEIGWWLDTREAKFMYDPPYVYRPSYPAPQHPQAVNKCPGILDYEARHVIVNCPFDIHIRLVRNPQGKFEITVHGMETSVDVHKLRDGHIAAPAARLVENSGSAGAATRHAISLCVR